MDCEMLDMDEIQPNFPPLQQNQLFEAVRNRIGITKYIDFLRNVKSFLEEQKQQNKPAKKKSIKAKYDTYIDLAIERHYSDEELELKNNGKNIVDALKNTDLHSSYIQNQIEQYLEESHVHGSYFDATNLQEGFMPPEYEGMSEADHKVLNHKYFSTTTLIQGLEGARPSKEVLANISNDRKIQDVEDVLHDADMQIIRNQKLQAKLQLIIDQQLDRNRLQKKCQHKVNVPLILKSPPNSKSAPASNELEFYHDLDHAVLNKKGEPMNPGTKTSVEFSEVELAALADLYGSRRKGPNRKTVIDEESQNLIIHVRESLNTDPRRTAKYLLPLLQAYSCTLDRMKQDVIGESAKTMGTLYLNSIRRNSDTIKQNEYPCLSYENLLKEVSYPDSGKDAPKTSFSEKGDDVWTQLRQLNGLIMQVETVKWHKEGFELLRIGASPALCKKLKKFMQTMKVLFDVKIEDNTCSRVHKGKFDGLELYGDEWLYLAIRLYHVLLVRLHSAFLQAEVDTTEYEFRKHCNEVGKARLLEKNPDAFLSEEGKMAMGLQSIKLPPTEGTPDEKMDRFLEAVKKREVIKGRHNPYSVDEFEADVMWAIGVEGNKLFTLPTILERLREAVIEIDDANLDSFERFFLQEKDGVKDAELKYEDEVFYAAKEWFFAFECHYSDKFLDDDWGSIGEYGDVCRLIAKIVKSGPISDKIEGKGAGLTLGKRFFSTPSRGRPAKKKRKTSKPDGSKR